MKRKTSFRSPIVFILMLFPMLACNHQQCTNTNKIFDLNTPASQIYKAELAKQLEFVDRQNLRYFFQNYEETDGQTLLYLRIEGKDLCATIALTVKQWEKLENLKTKKGISYKGAEFRNLQFDIQQDSSKTEFIYKTVERIID